MNLLFVHQSFPGQYRHIIRYLSESGSHQIVGLGLHQCSEPLPNGVKYFRYSLQRGNTPGIHDWLLDIDSKLIRGEACAYAAQELNRQGFIPDIICAHPGWGECLFLKEIWPSVPILAYQEFYYRSFGADFDFDPEFQSSLDWKSRARLRLKNANPLLMLEAADWNITPTNFQKSTFPRSFHHKFSVIHDGIDTSLASPKATLSRLQLPNNISLSSSDAIVTFVNRTIEPHRGCHTFLRSIPHIQRSNPHVHIIVVGSTTGVSYGKPAPSDSWLNEFIPEIQGQCDLNKVHFVGSLPYHQYLSLLNISSCHVYLTYPFVLSWSLLEAMSFSLPVVGSSTSPVQEVISDSYNGLLVNFFSPEEVADSVSQILKDSVLSAKLGANARQTILDNYSLEKCIPNQFSLMQLVSSKRIC